MTALRCRMPTLIEFRGHAAVSDRPPDVASHPCLAMFGPKYLVLRSSMHNFLAGFFRPSPWLLWHCPMLYWHELRLGEVYPKAGKDTPTENPRFPREFAESELACDVSIASTRQPKRVIARGRRRALGEWHYASATT